GFLVVYSHFLYTCPGKAPTTDQWGEIQNPAFCHIAELPIDNALPFIYAQNVLTNHARSLVIDWSIADRPPLQIGASLPIVDIAHSSNQFTKYAYYYVFVIFLQLTWIAAAWGVLNTLLKQRWKVWALLIGFGTTGFFYINSVFVWPKLLSASLAVFAVFLILDLNKRRKRLFDYRYVIMASLALALGLLSHTGIVFTAVGLVPIVVYDLIIHGTFRTLKLKPLLIAFAVALLLLVPWQVTKDHLTKHDRLIKWQLAGVISANDNRGTLQTIKDQYKKLTFKEWANDKWTNTHALFINYAKTRCGFGISTMFNKCNMASWRLLTFFSTFWAFEFFIFGFLILVWQLVKRSLDKFDVIVLWTAFLSLAFWILVMYVPGSTVLHQGSYATEMLLFILLGRKLAGLPRYAFAPLIALQVLLFYMVWLRPFGIHII
ncbi:MAG TPA: hypothetical protein VN554_01715, partial [Verrucomicrobiae bacterium]|nr:hypothetical protein [Verrucomicrobiae bacterium]